MKKLLLFLVVCLLACLGIYCYQTYYQQTHDDHEVQTRRTGLFTEVEEPAVQRKVVVVVSQRAANLVGSIIPDLKASKHVIVCIQQEPQDKQTVKHDLTNADQRSLTYEVADLGDNEHITTCLRDNGIEDHEIVQIYGDVLEQVCTLRQHYGIEQGTQQRHLDYFQDQKHTIEDQQYTSHYIVVVHQQHGTPIATHIYRGIPADQEQAHADYNDNYQLQLLSDDSDLDAGVYTELRNTVSTYLQQSDYRDGVLWLHFKRTDKQPLGLVDYRCLNLFANNDIHRSFFDNTYKRKAGKDPKTATLLFDKVALTAHDIREAKHHWVFGMDTSKIIDLLNKHDDQGNSEAIFYRIGDANLYGISDQDQSLPVGDRLICKIVYYGDTDISDIVDEILQGSQYLPIKNSLYHIVTQERRNLGGVSFVKQPIKSMLGGLFGSQPAAEKPDDDKPDKQSSKAQEDKDDEQDDDDEQNTEDQDKKQDQNQPGYIEGILATVLTKPQEDLVRIGWMLAGAGIVIAWIQ